MSILTFVLMWFSIMPEARYVEAPQNKLGTLKGEAHGKREENDMEARIVRGFTCFKILKSGLM